MASTARLVQGIVIPVVLLGLVAGGLGCPSGEAPGVAHARSVYRQTMDANPEYEKYGLSRAAGTPAPWVREQLVQATTSQNFQIALAAVRALAEEPPAEAHDALRAVFDQRPGALRLQAAIGLAHLGDADAVQFLEDQISDPAQPLPVEAVQALAGVAGGPEFLDKALGERIGGDNLTLRNEAYAALAGIREPWARALLVKGLEKEHGEERVQAITSIGRSGDPALATSIERFANTQGLVFATLEALGALGNPSSVPVVRKMAASDEAPVRTYAGVALWRLGQKDEALAVLDPLLASDDASVRRIVAAQLGGVDDPKAVEMLSTLATGDPDTDVKIAALRSLHDHANAALVPTLVQAARDHDYQVQALALDLMAHVGGAQDVEPILPLLDSGNPYVAISAALAVLSMQAGVGA